MSVCGQSGQTEDDSASEEVTTNREKTSEIHKQKPASKVVRVLTVLAYLLSVSLAAILLSVYYIWVWKSPDLPLADNNISVSARRANRSDYEHYSGEDHHIYGRGNTTVNGNVTVTPPTNIAISTTVNASDTTMDTTQHSTDVPSTTDLPQDGTNPSETTEDLISPSDDIGRQDNVT